MWHTSQSSTHLHWGETSLSTILWFSNIKTPPIWTIVYHRCCTLIQTQPRQSSCLNPQMKLSALSMSPLLAVLPHICVQGACHTTQWPWLPSVIPLLVYEPAKCLRSAPSFAEQWRRSSARRFFRAWVSSTPNACFGRILGCFSSQTLLLPLVVGNGLAYIQQNGSTC